MTPSNFSSNGNAPAFPSYAYFQRPPQWVRNLVSVFAALLVVTATMGLVAQSAEEAAYEFEKVGEKIDDGTSAPVEKFTVEGRFKAAFPIKPKARTESLAEEGVEVNIDIYTAVADGRLYVVSTLPFEIAIPFSFEGLPEEAASEFDGSVESTKPMTFQGYEAMEVVIKAANDKLVREMFVRTNTQLVSIIVGGGSVETYEQFRDSIELLA
ncbi:MAG: hypothetical protein Q8K63_13605 [Acidimicrobiales bacterium]|nr:hypothetical protein [Acidimicrobiales bacterium]